MHPLEVSRRIARQYRAYLRSTFAPKQEVLARELERALHSSAFKLTRGPYLQLTPPYESKGCLEDLIAEGVLCEEFRSLESSALPLDRPLYVHQEEALRRAVGGRRNLVIATGTGSGKTECFLLPILDALLREQSAGTLGPGVRALLLYPMNALANDQLKRLRQLLARVPQITFGRYVGETCQKEKDAEADFALRFPGEPRLKNELISREQMQEAPPHLLLTNYAMLEYLLLRPADSPLFDGGAAGSWRFIVLDEAHVYGGARGTEIAMLLRRVRDRVLESRKGQLQCFATSATLGSGRDSYPLMAKFGRDLFDEPFEWVPSSPERQDVIGSSTKAWGPCTGTSTSFPPEVWEPLSARFRESDASVSDLKGILQSHGATWSAAKEDEGRDQFMTEVLEGETHVSELRKALFRGPRELFDVAREVFQDQHSGQHLIDLVSLASAVRRSDGAGALVSARYHFFLRALEGAFLCVSPTHPQDAPRLTLERHEDCPECEKSGQHSKMFELAVCRRCGAEYLVGTLGSSGPEGIFRPAAIFDAHVCYLLLGESLDATSEDEDEAAVGPDVDQTAQSQWLCAGCGLLSNNAAGTCACGATGDRVKVTVVRPAKGQARVRKCAACSGRATGDILYRFLTGADAPVSVLATDLYQSLPPSSEPAQLSYVGQGRKLITFSDSRQDAAFFAPYFERTYMQAVRRRLLAQDIDELKHDRPRLEDLTVRVRTRAERALVLDPDMSVLSRSSAVKTWLMGEILAVDRRQSLEGTGTAEIAVAIPMGFEPPQPLLALGFSASECEDLIRLLLETVRLSGAVSLPAGVDIADPVFAPRNVQLAIRAAGPDPTSRVLSWLPGSGTNRREDLVDRIFRRRGITADRREILEGVWRLLVDQKGPWSRIFVAHSDPRHGTLYRLAHEQLEFLARSDGHEALRCDTCRQTWWRSITGVCPAYRCQGTVAPIGAAPEGSQDHYARLYQTLVPIGAKVEEHTAQWAPAAASRIQDQFIRGEINVLSCSTTFELGVDIGDVQAVLLRNVPPSPANYVQRAGRAGRRASAPAMIVTFAQRRSHDLNFFAEPLRMIEGVIPPPDILLENPAIVRRHVHSIAFSAFERQAGAHKAVSDFFVDGLPDTADKKFLTWLEGQPRLLHAALLRIVPVGVASDLGIQEWKWVGALREPQQGEPTFGWLARAAEQVRDDLASVQELLNQAVVDKKFSRANQLQYLQRTLEKQDLLQYLAANNVLPKYGFPVDVVTMHVTGDDKAADVNLSRDLKLAISEYAPGGEVVAAKSLWTSLGLRTLPDRTWPRYGWAQCATCQAFRYQLETVAKQCPVCGSDKPEAGMQGSFVMPIFGFVGERSLSRPGEQRPPLLAVTETFFGAFSDGAAALGDELREAKGVKVLTRYGRQGQIVVVNRGPAGRGFRVCEWCGYGEPTPAAVGRAAPKKSHRDIRRPGKTCNGSMHFTHLGHRFLTDVVEMRAGMPMTDDNAMSALYALLEGAAVLSISRDDIDGTLHRYGHGQPPAFVLFDTVPGGAGHVKRISENLEDVFKAAVMRLEACACGPETSCYGCLRNYSNQRMHERLSRGSAIGVLSELLG